MRKINYKILALVAGLGIALNTTAQTVAPFKKGDRVVFVGNSITDGGHYHSYIWLYYITRFPNMPLRVFNSGIGGDVARQIDDRFEDDVFRKKPTVVTLTFGMNDTGYQFLSPDKADSVYGQKIKTSYESFLKIEKKLAAHPEIRKVMIGSSPYDETSKIKARPLTGKNSAIQKVAAFLQASAAKNGWGFVDFNYPMVEINKEQEKTDSAFTLQGVDRIHPFNDGHMVMAYLFLKAQGLAGKKVAGLDVNTARSAVRTDNCVVTDLKVGAQSVSFDYLAHSLPYPVDTLPQGGGKQLRSQADAMNLVPFVKEFNQETLKLTGLSATKSYEVMIDKTVVGKWTGAQLDKGINLAVIHSTPQYQQAMAVMQLNEERWTIERRLREYYWLHYSILQPKGMLYNDSEATMDSLQNYAKKDFFVAVTLPTYRNARFKAVRDAWEKEMDLLIAELYRINQPRVHHFTIRVSAS